MAKQGRELKEAKIQELMVRRSVMAASSYWILFALIVFGTSSGADNLRQSLVIGFFLLLFGCGRMWSTWRAYRPRVLYAVVFLNSLTWGAFCFLTLRQYHLSETSFALLLSTAGICSGLMLNFAPSFGLLIAQLLNILLPVIAGFAVGGSKEELLCAVLAGVYLLYSLMSARKVSDSFLQDLEKSEIIGAQKEKLEIALKDAVSAAGIKNDFLSMMSHEIRTPLNGIVGMTHVLSQETGLTESQTETVRLIRDCGQSLLVIVNDVLDFSKIESGKMDIEKRDFDISEVISSSMKFFESTAQRKGLKLQALIAPEMPSLIHGDSNRVRQILLNLLSNAIKFTEKGAVTLTVRAEQVTIDTFHFYFSVEDTGIGISEENFPRLFRMFSQVDASTARRFGGTGLGLAICQKLCHLMDGDIRVESQEGKGSTFSFFLPFQLAQELPSLRAGGALEPARQVSSRVPVRILVAEDNLVNQKVLRAFLAKAGTFEVECKANGLEVFEELQMNQYDLIFMDCQMPGMDGYETTRKIRQIESLRRIPIIALTANALEGDREKCMQAGMDDYLSKPIQFDQLSTILEKWLKHLLSPKASA